MSAFIHRRTPFPIATWVRCGTPVPWGSLVWLFLSAVFVVDVCAAQEVPRTNLAPINSTPVGTPNAFSTPGVTSTGNPVGFQPRLPSTPVLGGGFPQTIPATSYPTLPAPAPTSNAYTSPFAAPINNGPSNGSLFGDLFGNGFLASSASQPVYTGAAAPFNNGSIAVGPPQSSLAAASGSYYGGTPYGAPASYPPLGSSYPAYPPPAYPGAAYPSGAPTSLFPGGLYGGSGAIPTFTGPLPFRFLQGPRLRHSFLPGGSGNNKLQINDTDVSIAMAFPRFLFSSQPLYVIPSFSLHQWEGPITAGGVTADLPGQAYSAFIDFAWQSDPAQIVGAELGVRVGVFTDFDTFEDESFRVMGKALGLLRLTPRTTLKLGVLYLDRNSVEILPAGGILYQPTPYSRCDIYFPSPKFSRYLSTVGTNDVWWYVGGEFGGGVWTVGRAGGGYDEVSMDDIRVLLGLEWGQNQFIAAGRRTAFAEIGYVFSREVEYSNNPADNFEADDSFIIRVGIGY